ncbi:aldose epimerase family protein [Streptomyces litchfieldiae]|uniref:Aldose 1-epimerase n=1 Tax=Streptomyces litchfieldiae TaxID=3075543 RepID=A0ABU2MTP1_9ACTN|nr:aldose 1-epimerase [Streptomyces sp. DSM 44938]MDT0345007.1 aldose 1-epimerase [Streptomyces sp. DSM 44938]
MTTHDTDRGVRLRAADAELTLRPDQGGRISSLVIDGIELLRQGERFGSFVMAPWCGRTRAGQFRNGGIVHQMPLDAGPHAIHGTVRHRPWRTARADVTSAALICELTDPWPYAGRVSQEVALAEDGGGVTLTLGVETLGDSFPAQAGWHPWFLRNLTPGGPDVEIAFTADWQEERGADHLPTGHRVDPKPGPWDDCFGMADGVAVTLTWPGQLELTVTSRSEWVVVYDELPEAVCVEPQSGPPNGLNTHPRLVTELEPLEISTTWTWRRLA